MDRLMLQPGLGSRESRFTVRFVGFPGPSVAPLCAHRELVRAVHTDYNRCARAWPMPAGSFSLTPGRQGEVSPLLSAVGW